MDTKQCQKIAEEEYKFHLANVFDFPSSFLPFSFYSSAALLPPVLKHSRSKLKLERKHLNKQLLLPSKINSKALRSSSTGFVLIQCLLMSIYSTI